MKLLIKQTIIDLGQIIAGEVTWEGGDVVGSQMLGWLLNKISGIL